MNSRFVPNEVHFSINIRNEVNFFQIVVNCLQKLTKFDSFLVCFACMRLSPHHNPSLSFRFADRLANLQPRKALRWLRRASSIVVPDGTKTRQARAANIETIIIIILI